MLPSNEIAVVIATRNRPTFLREVVDALMSQSVRPVVTIVVDSSDKHAQQANAQTLSRSNLNMRHIFSGVKSLTHQKNLALDIILTEPSIAFVQILDDDTIPDQNHLATLRKTLIGEPNVIGVSGVTIPKWTVPKTRSSIRAIFRLCGLDSHVGGRVTPAGIGIPVDLDLPDTQASEWLFGCSMWRRELFLNLRYASDFVGSGLFEDVEFSTRARHFGELRVNPSATLLHRMADSGRPDSFLYAYRFVRNRRRVVRNLGMPRSLVMFPLSILIQTVVYLTKQGERGGLLRGTARAIIDEVRHRPLR
jgi:GT2 family glycosyltransferase